MSGTRKIGKFDPSGGTQKMGKFDPASATDDTPELPTRPFQPRTPDGFAELPTLPFEPRSPSPSGPPEAAPEASAAAVSSAVEEPAAAPPPEEAAADLPGFEPGEWVPPQSGPTSGNEAEAFRTHLTQKFVDLANSVTSAFVEFTIGAGAWGVELTAPQGMSTGGGKQALQHLRMRPRRNGYAVLVVGTVNQLEKRAELRDFDHVTILHEVRYQKPLELTSPEWEQFLRKAEVVLNGAGIQSMRTPPPRELLDQRRSMQRISKRAVVTLVVVLTLAAVVLWRVAATLFAR